MRLPEIHMESPDDSFASFQTIDWLHDEGLERAAVRAKRRAAYALPWELTSESLVPKLMFFWHFAQTWVCAVCIGAVCGCLAAVIDVIAELCADLRTGYCRHAYWTAKQACCRLGQSLDGCDGWRSWSDVAGLTLGGVTAGSWAFDYAVYVCACLALGYVSVLLVLAFAPYAAGSGIAEIKAMLAGSVIRRNLSPWTLLVRTLCVPTAVATGLSIGKEGPLVHIAAAVGSMFCDLFPSVRSNAAKRRGMIAVAASAGVAVAFGAPIAGVLFALEEVAYYFPPALVWQGFLCSLVGATTLAMLDPYHTGRLRFQTSARTATWIWLEVPGFAAAGALGGLAGALFVRFNVRWSAVRKHTALRAWPKTEVAVLVAVTAAVNYLCYFTRIDGVELIALLFSQCNHSAPTTPLPCAVDASPVAVASLAVAGVTKLILMVFSSGMKVPAGVFVPSLVAGACLGRAYGAVAAAVFRASPFIYTECNTHTGCIDPALYAVCGAAAVLCGVSRMTASLVVLLFEVTGGVSYLVPLAATVLAARTAADLLVPDNVYVAQIRLQEYPFLDPKADHDLDASIAALCRPPSELEAIAEHGNTVGSLARLLARTRANGFPVLTASRGVLGFISRHDLATVIAEAAPTLGPQAACMLSRRVPREFRTIRFIDLRPFMDPTPICVVDTTPFSTAADIVKRTGARQLIVLDRGVCAGVLTRKDLLAYVRRCEARDAATMAAPASATNADRATLDPN